ncbi:conserved hypothetical protein [Desulfovibrionales bacterium]
MPTLPYRSLTKNLLYMILGCLMCGLMLETVLATAYYHAKYKNKPLALVQAAESIKSRLTLLMAKKRVEEADFNLPPRLWEALYSEPGRELLGQFFKEYETFFIQLLNRARTIRAHVLVAYIPRGEDTPKSPSRRTCRPFFRELAARHHVNFLDLTDTLTTMPANQVYLLPFDGHLSRLGCQLIASAMAGQLIGWNSYRSNHAFSKEETPLLLADLAQNQRALWNMKPDAPFLLITDQYGFRRSNDFSLRTELQKILILGDSIAFCPYLPNHDTWPVLLEELIPRSVVMNAGVPGYTIMDEVELFLDKAQYASPDVIVLEVFDNDLYDFFSFKRNEFARTIRPFVPSPAEIMLLEQLRRQPLTP